MTRTARTLRLRKILSILTGLFFLAATGCSRVRLEFPEIEVEEAGVDNLLRVSGDLCVSPSTDVGYPVKITFVVDGSGSQQFADQNRQRVNAVVDTITALSGNEDVFFKIIVFNAAIKATPELDSGPEFVNSLASLRSAINNLAEADTLTDYQGALAAAYSGIRNDIQTVSSSPSGASELSRTKYLTILISDGLPDPQCTAGLCNDTDPTFAPDPACGGLRTNLLCEDQDFINCILKTVPGISCSGGICSFGRATCNDQGDLARDLFGGIQTALSAGADYNQPYQILDVVADIMQLQEDHGVGEVRVHAGLVLDPLVDPAVIEVFGDPAQAIPLMRQIAEVGQTEFLEFYGGDSINFVGINFQSLRQPRVVRSFWADNLSTKTLAQGLAVDSDTDGLPDEKEFSIRSNPLTPDTDCDGYSDFVEERLRGFGFDFNNPCKPAPPNGVACTPPTNPCDAGVVLQDNCQQPALLGCIALHGVDSDLDGLSDCEEMALRTACNNADTDADGADDRTELHAGMDPLVWDIDLDLDQDGESNRKELKWHLNPVIEQSRRQKRERYYYSQAPLPPKIDGRACFRFDVERIRLATTGNAENTAGVAAGVGENIIRLYVAENLADALTAPPIYRTACIRARYLEPTIKRPLDGSVQLFEEDFHYLIGPDPFLIGLTDTFDINNHCLDTCSDFSECTGCRSCATGVCRDAGWECCDDSSCGGGSQCVAHVCKNACSAAAPCADTERCVEGFCSTVCSSDLDCSAPQTCQDDGLCWIAVQN